MSLVATDITCRRSGRDLFKPVSFTLAPGNALILRGPNGAGKTTLLRAMAGFLPFASGTLALDGAPLADHEGALVYSGHTDALKPALTAAENFDFWQALYGASDTAQIDAALDLAPLRPRLAGRLSAGQKRRLGLARLGLSGARVWLMDEPTVSLDTDTVSRLTGLVRRHLDGGGMAVIATHIPVDLPATDLTLERAEATFSDPFLDPVA